MNWPKWLVIILFAAAIAALLGLGIFLGLYLARLS
jgi:hypothetical protein